jgi:glucokinase
MWAIGVDIGGTNTRSALIDTTTGRVTGRRHHPSFVGDWKAGVRALAYDVQALSGKKKIPVGIAIASQLDPKRRKALMAPNLKWENVALAQTLERILSVPVVVDNDVRSAAAGELRFGALRTVRSHTAAAVFWGSGVGGAVIADGRVQTGALSLAGEVGHLALEPGGRLCGCGKKGCFEAYIGGHMLSARAKRPTHELLAAADAGEKAAFALVEEAVGFFGLLVSHVANLLDPQAVVIGGGLGLRLFDRVAPAVAPHLLKVRDGEVRLVRARLGDDAGILGAATLATSA